MLKKLLTIIFAATLIACSSGSNPDTAIYLEEIEGMTLEEAVEYVKKQNDEFQRFVNFFSEPFSFGDSEPRKYEKDEEEYTDLPKFMATEEIERSYNEYFFAIYLWQTYQYPQTEIKIENDKFGTTIPQKPTYHSRAIYYHDGTVDIVPQKISEWMDLNTTKVIDSIQLTATYSYTTAYDSYEVADKLNVDGGSIKITKKGNNILEMRLSGNAADYEKIVALNEEGKPLQNPSSSSTSEGADKVVKKYAKAFNSLAQKADKFESIDELKQALTKTLSGLPSLNEGDQSTLYTGTFKGNVKSAIVYVPQNTVSKEVELTLVNLNACKYSLVFTEDTEKKKYGFTNQQGEWIIEPQYTDLYQVNDLYYYRKAAEDDDEGVNEIYYLDTENALLNRLHNVLYWGGIYDNCMIAEKDDKLALWGAGGKPVTGYIYAIIEQLDGSDNLIRVRANGRYGLIDTLGKTILPVEYTYIGSIAGDRIIVDKNNKPYMFTDTGGRQLISLTQYDSADEFADGLAMVRKNDKRGFIDKSGKVVIPLKYDRAESFSHGVTMVGIDGKYGLIDTRGHEVVAVEHDNHSMSTSFDKRTYRFSGVKYNEYGNPVVDDSDDD